MRVWHVWQFAETFNLIDDLFLRLLHRLRLRGGGFALVLCHLSVVVFLVVRARVVRWYSLQLARVGLVLF